MAIVGSPTYNPDGGFAFIRAYVPQITFGFAANAIITHSAEQFYITDGNNLDVHVVVNFFDKFWAWSSNGYTIDHLVVDSWVELTSVPGVKFPLNFNLFYKWDAANHRPEMLYYLPGYTDRYTFQLPPATAPYWVPPYL